MAGTIREIAELAGVSRGTVDRALNNRGRVNPDVAEKIHRIADEIGYIPNRKKGTDKQKNRKIGVVTQLSKASFMIEIKKGIQDAGIELQNRDIELLIRECMSVDEEEQLKAIDDLVDQGVSAIAIMPVECNRIRDKINYLTEERNIHVVTFNSDIVGTKRSCFVGLNNKKSGQTAAGLMGMMTGGKGKVLAVTGYFGNSASSLRVDGFVEELKESFSGMELVGVQSSFDDKTEMEKIIVNTMKVFPDLNGIVVFSGGQGGIRTAFEKMGLKKRPHVIIFDLTPNNINLLREQTVDFLIDQNGYTQGYRSLILLAEMIQKDKTADMEFIYTEITIKTKYNL